MLLFFTSAFSPMELSATAMILAMILCTSARATHHDSSGAAAQQRKLACSRTFWCCDRAPRGWHLFHLSFPWIILLVLCMPCLIATAESMMTMEAEWLQSNFHSVGVGVQVHDHESVSIGHPVIDEAEDVKIDEAASSSKGLSVAAPKDDCNTNLSRSLEGEPHGSLAQEELLPALCMLSGWSHVWQAFLSTNLQTDSSVEITLHACSVQEQSASAIIDWGSNRLTSVAFKFLTLTNRHSNAELRVSKVLTSNAQFCTVNFQGIVLSPGSRLSILIAYIPNHIGKVESIMLVQTSTGSFKVKNIGEGLPSLIKIHPALSLAVVTRAEWQETISLVNPFGEHLSITEAYVWMQPRNKQIKGEGVFCRNLDFRPECSYCGRLKVRPIRGWSVAPHSSTPVIDFSIMGDDREHLVGTLCLKIYRHSVQLAEVLVLPWTMEWLGVAIISTEAFGKKSLLEAKSAEEEDSGWAMFRGKTISWQVLVREEISSTQRANQVITLPIESLKLRLGVTKEIGAKYLIGCSGGKILVTSRLCCIREGFVSGKVLRHLKYAVYQAVLVPCSALSRLCGKCGSNDDGKERCLPMCVRCAENSYYQDCLNMLLVPCKVNAKERGVASAYGPEYICGHKSVSRHMAREYYMAVVMITEHCSNKSITCSPNILPKVMACLLFFSPVDLVEDKNKGHEFNIVSPCACCSLVTEGCSHSWIGCKLSDSSVSIVSEAVEDNDSECDWGAFKHHDREKDTGTSFILQGSSFMTLQTVICETLNQIEPGNVYSCGLENTGFCEKPMKPLDLLEVDSFERGWCEPHSFPLNDSMVDNSLQVCYAPLIFSRYQKFVLKVFLVIVFSVFIVLVKMLRHEKLLMTDVRLRHSCSDTFFLHSVCLKASYTNGAERESTFKHAPTRFDELKSMNCGDDPCHESRFLNVLAGLLRSVGFVLRWVFDSQATIVNVRVQIAESPCVDQASYPRDSCLVSDKDCSMGPKFVEKPAGFQTSSVQATENISCAENSRSKFSEAETMLPPIGLSTTHYTAECFLQRPSSTNPNEDLEQSFKEKKDKGKRKKKRNNITDLKQESERMGQSASSSPPSSPASPATPLAYGSRSPFSRSNSPSRSFKGVSNSSGPPSRSFCDSSSRKSSSIQFSSEMLSQLDTRGDQARYTATKKGTSQHLHTFGSKATSQISVKKNLPGKGSVRKDSPKDSSSSENWAAVARRAIATTNEPDEWQGSASPSRSSSKGVAQARPLLFPSATFPQRGRCMQWSPRMLEKTSFDLREQLTSPSLVSTSLVAPHARAPGSKPSMACNESPLGNNSRRATLQVNRTGVDVGMDQGPRNDEYLYDIWGDHFAEFCRNAQPNALCGYANDMVGMALPESPRAESLFVASTRVLSYADVALSPISQPSSEGFSIFSRDAFYSPSQQKDATGSFASGS